jgi:molybdenum cofactor cytidylyltransferase
MHFTGVLLAAGRGRRFDPAGGRLKLLAPYPAGSPDAVPLAVAAARALRAVLPVVAVVRAAPAGAGAAPDAAQWAQLARLQVLLEAEGCRVLSSANADSGAAALDAADEGTGCSIACAVRASTPSDGWIVALADMPCIRPATIAAVQAALRAGARTAAPWYRGQRGHPVGFAAACREELAALRGDEGARALLQRYPPQRVEVDDPGVLFDVDEPADLAAAPQAPGAP